MSPTTTVTGDSVTFRLPAEPGVTGARLELDFPIDPTDPEFTRTDQGWHLQLPGPAVDRLEYQFTVRDGNGTRWQTDPSNPRTVPNPFGDKSEILFPGYRPPAWLGTPATGTLQPVPTAAGRLSDAVPVTIWAPDGLQPLVAAPLLLVHDGTDMAERGSLLRWAAAASGRQRPFRVALLDPVNGRRDEWYAAGPEYADHLAGELLPALRGTVAVSSVVGLGASLGALAMLYAHRRSPGLFDALVLQSGSFFTRALDGQESGYGSFDRICAAVAELSARAGVPCPVRMTCGLVEENRANNESMAAALRRQGFPVELRLVRDAHTMIGWRDAWSPGLAGMVDAAGGRRPEQGSD